MLKNLELSNFRKKQQIHEISVNKSLQITEKGKFTWIWEKENVFNQPELVNKFKSNLDIILFQLQVQ